MHKICFGVFGAFRLPWELEERKPGNKQKNMKMENVTDVYTVQRWEIKEYFVSLFNFFLLLNIMLHMIKTHSLYTEDFVDYLFSSAHTSDIPSLCFVCLFWVWIPCSYTTWLFAWFMVLILILLFRIDLCMSVFYLNNNFQQKWHRPVTSHFLVAKKFNRLS